MYKGMYEKARLSMTLLATGLVTVFAISTVLLTPSPVFAQECNCGGNRTLYKTVTAPNGCAAAESACYDEAYSYAEYSCWLGHPDQVCAGAYFTLISAEPDGDSCTVECTIDFQCELCE